MDALLTALAASLSWQSLLATFFGSLVGLIFGAIPGLTYSMALAMVLPITFTMGHTPAIAMTGDPDVNAEELREIGFVTLLRKPFTVGSLREAVAYFIG